MDEIEALREQLRLLQAQPASYVLTERNVVELVFKCSKLHMLPQLIFTLDGKEFMTPTRLYQEIEDELNARGGRADTLSFADFLHINQSDFDEQLPAFLKAKPTIVLVGSDLISKLYFDRMCEEVNQDLRVSGEVTIDELCKKFELSSDMFTQVLTERLGTVVHGTLDGGVIYTQTLIDKHYAMARGLLRAATYPIDLRSITHKRKLNDSIFMSAVEELIKDHQADGIVESGVFTPHVYLKARSQYVNSFFTQNGFVEYKMAEKLGAGRYFIENYLPKNSAVFLSTCCLRTSFVDCIETVLIDVITDKNWIDVAQYLPSVVTKADIKQLLEKCPTVCDSAQPKVVILDSTVISLDLLKTIMASFEKDLYVKAAAHAGTVKAKPTKPKKKEAPTKKGRGADRRKKIEEEEELEEEPPGLQVSVEEITEFCKKFIKDDPDGEVAEAVAIHLSDQVEEMYAKLVSALSVDKSALQKDLFSKLQEHLCNLLTDSTLGINVLSLLPAEEGSFTEKHILRTWCTDILNILVYSQAIDQGVPIPPSVPSTAPPTLVTSPELVFLEKDAPAPHTATPLLTPQERGALMKQLSEDVAETLNTFLALIQKGKLRPFLDALPDVCETYQFHLRKIDKRLERERVLLWLHNLERWLKQESDCPTALHLSLELLNSRKHNAIVFTPPRCVPWLLGNIEHSVPAPVLQQLEEYHSYVGKFLRIHNTGAEVVPTQTTTTSKSSKSAPTTLGDTNTLAELTTSMTAKLPALITATLQCTELQSSTPISAPPLTTPQSTQPTPSASKDRSRKGRR
ncbi:E3 UFM1-protein ligase 1 [Pelomyxa schiedti]|nr:E3 UFM1-protein ligase 1 [Pelomyxa schiedti]